MKLYRYIILFIIVISLSACTVFPIEEQQSISGKQMTVTFLDVSQGDCSVIMLPDKRVILIDSGEKDEAEKVIRYLNSQDITKIDYLIATHPHSDHIGGMADIMDKFSVGKVYMSDVSNETKTFERFLTAIKLSGVSVSMAKAGVVLFNEKNEDGSNYLSAEFVAPASNKYDEINDYSAVLRFSYCDVSFLFAADAEKVSEKEMVNSYRNLDADVLKVGHHGSNTSSCKDFLAAVNPKYAVISADGESYGHPHESTLKRLKNINSNIRILKTYEDGNITFTTDGKNISVKTENE